MAFLGKIFKKKCGKGGDSDDEELFPDLGPASSDDLDLDDEPGPLGRSALEEEAESGDGPEEFGRAALGGEMDAEDEEEELGLNRFQMNSVSIGDDDEEVPEDAKPGDTDDSEESEEEEGAISSSALMNIFEDEVIVDKQLSNLNSWVEEVDAQELLDEAQSLLEEMEAL